MYNFLSKRYDRFDRIINLTYSGGDRNPIWLTMIVSGALKTCIVEKEGIVVEELIKERK